MSILFPESKNDYDDNFFLMNEIEQSAFQVLQKIFNNENILKKKKKLLRYFFDQIDQKTYHIILKNLLKTY